jgi:alkenylglycerophosphocholine/alkenylglycerophosphoethanolamine hydrolase
VSQPRLKTPDKMLYAVFALGALGFLVLLPTLHPYPGSAVLKLAPILALAGLLLRKVSGLQGKLMVAGMLLSGCGDVILDIDRVGLFIPGLVAFLLAHLCYIAAFATELRFTARRAVPLTLLLVYALVVGWFLKDIPGDKLAPVMAYLVVITAMAMSAFLLRRPHPLIAIGAVAFMISDTIIAVNKFLVPIPESTLINISIYYAAQCMIVSGFVLRGTDGSGDCCA